MPLFQLGDESNADLDESEAGCGWEPGFSCILGPYLLQPHVFPHNLEKVRPFDLRRRLEAPSFWGKPGHF